MQKLNIKIIKRDGRSSDFNLAKIREAILKAAASKSIVMSEKTIGHVLDIILEKIQEMIGHNEEATVEKIQDVVVAVLKQEGHVQLAKLYQSYRVERNKFRDEKSDLANYIYKIGVETDRDNANVGNNFSAKLLRIASEASKWHVLIKLLPQEMAKAHEIGDIYIHDLDSYNLTINCLHLPTKKILESGFNPGYGTINKPTKIESAAALVCILLQSSQNDMFGGQSHPNFDNDLAEYVELTRKEIKKEMNLVNKSITDEEVEKILLKRVDQAMQGIVYNLNTMHSRAGAQVPFSSLNLGLVYSKDAAIVCESFLKMYDKGLGKGEQPIFPNIIFRVKEGVNRDPKDPYFYLFDLACHVASRRMNPTFMNIDADFNLEWHNKGYTPSTMGCRTYLMSNVNGKPGVEGRGNNAPCTINIVKLAIMAAKNIDKFFELLEEKIEFAKEQLLHRYSVIKKLKVKDLPFVCGNGLMRGSEGLSRDSSIDPVVKQGSFGIGFLGLAETLTALTGKHHGESDESQELGLKIVGLIRQRCDEYTKKHKLNFSCYATPAEGLSGVFTKKDQSLYGFIEGVTSKNYYTNSFHVPVSCKISYSKKIALEAPYHKMCNAGHITFIEFDGLPTKENIMKIVTYAYTQSNINYVAINYHLRYCEECGTR